MSDLERIVLKQIFVVRENEDDHNIYGLSEDGKSIYVNHGWEDNDWTRVKAPPVGCGDEDDES